MKGSGVRVPASALGKRLSPAWRVNTGVNSRSVRSGMPLEYMRQLLGLSRIEDTLPYARLVRGSLDGQMEKLDTIFTDLVQPADIAA
jgi:hypothetical protein